MTMIMEKKYKNSNWNVTLTVNTDLMFYVFSFLLMNNYGVCYFYIQLSTKTAWLHKS